MYYALTVNGDLIITGVHESLSVISTNMFISNPNYADDEVIVIDSPAEFESDMDIRCYNEDGTLKPLLWRIENGYTPLPFDKEIINGELVDKEVPAEEQPKSLMEYLDEQFAGARKESSDCIDAVKAESNARVQSMKPLFTELVKGKPQMSSSGQSSSFSLGHRASISLMTSECGKVNQNAVAKLMTAQPIAPGHLL